ncbi:hypothetical protein B566_EDAN016362 [Ephemera danica]|nr:hypothetical protein B566_EDAN016362 [Ephemera danica]
MNFTQNLLIFFSVAAYKKKAFQYQEDLDQLEGFQTQEMAKIKHLLLEREQQLTENTATIAKLQTDISRLRGCQEELSNVQDELDAVRHSSEQQRQKLSAKLDEAESEGRLLAEKLARAESLLTAATSSDGALEGALAEARDSMERRLEETRLELADVKSKWCSQVVALETQLGRLSIQAGEEGAERRRAEQSLKEAEQRIATVIEERDKVMTQLAQAEAAKKEVETREEEKDKEIVNLQQRVSTLESDNNALSTRCACIESLESERDSLAEKCVVLKSNQRDEAEECRLKESAQSLERECQELRERLSGLQASQEAKDVAVERCKETANALNAERDSLLLRNASLSQQGELACKELQEEISELKSLLDQQKQESGQQLTELRNQLEQMRQSDLTATVVDLEEQLADKNKTVRVLQQRLADMKKTLQRELKCPSQNSDFPNASGSAGNNSTFDHNSLLDGAALAVSGKPGNEDINHAYLKHAKHLTRAVATLLHFTPEEERLLRETLEWKMSWFGTKPNLGNGQTAKTIPPS